jgi:hypothetical protein
MFIFLHHREPTVLHRQRLHPALGKNLKPRFTGRTLQDQTYQGSEFLERADEEVGQAQPGASAQPGSGIFTLAQNKGLLG